MAISALLLLCVSAVTAGTYVHVKHNAWIMFAKASGAMNSHISLRDFNSLVMTIVLVSASTKSVSALLSLWTKASEFEAAVARVQSFIIHDRCLKPGFFVRWSHY